MTNADHPELQQACVISETEVAKNERMPIFCSRCLISSAFSFLLQVQVSHFSGNLTFHERPLVCSRDIETEIDSECYVVGGYQMESSYAISLHGVLRIP